MERVAVALSMVLLGVTLLAGSASAECAWVLWLEVVVTGSPSIQKAVEREWSVWTATPTYADCQVALTRSWQARLDDTTTLRDKMNEINTASGVEQRAEMRSAPGFVSLRTPFGRGIESTRSYNYSCLPDTIDPRGPKR